MSIVAWDGKTLATDRMGDANGLKCEMKKSKRIDHRVVIAWTGGIGEGLAMARWWNTNDGNHSAFPAFQSDERRWCRLIVATSKECFYYEQTPERIPVLEKFAAFGSGRDYALGAMVMGADAKTAVEIAIRFDLQCGFGVDAYDLLGDVSKWSS